MHAWWGSTPRLAAAAEAGHRPNMPPNLTPDQTAVHCRPGVSRAASVADSLVSGLSIYTDHTHTGEHVAREQQLPPCCAPSTAESQCPAAPAALGSSSSRALLEVHTQGTPSAGPALSCTSVLTAAWLALSRAWPANAPSSADQLRGRCRPACMPLAACCCPSAVCCRRHHRGQQQCGLDCGGQATGQDQGGGGCR